MSCQWCTDVQDAATAHTSLLQLGANPRQCFILPSGTTSSLSALLYPALGREGAVLSQPNGGMHLSLLPVMVTGMLLVLLVQDPRVQCPRGVGNLLFPAGSRSALVGSLVKVSPAVTLGCEWDMQGLE